MESRSGDPKIKNRWKKWGKKTPAEETCKNLRLKNKSTNKHGKAKHRRLLLM